MEGDRLYTKRELLFGLLTEKDLRRGRDSRRGPYRTFRNRHGDKKLHKRVRIVLRDVFVGVCTEGGSG